jgi:hypothetical protein
VASHIGSESSALWDTTEKILLRCGIQGDTTLKTLAVWDTTEENYQTSRKCSLVVFYKGGKYLPLYPITEKNLLRKGIQQRKTSSVVSFNTRNAAALYRRRAKNKKKLIAARINFSAK